MANAYLRRKYFDNTVDPFIPELWAQESLAILEENMVIGNLVHRDFENTIANFGDTVHTRRPGEFVATRKWVTDDVTVQDVTATDVAVVLNQHIHVSFLIRDGEQSLSFKDLVQVYMHPAMLAQARFIDQVLLGQYAGFMPNVVGGIGNFDANVKSYILDAREKMNRNKAYVGGRNLILTSGAESSALKPEFFTSAEKVGDQGLALREAMIGRKLGFDTYMSQNAASVVSVASTAGAINNAAGYVKGSTVLTVDGITGLWLIGDWVTIGGVPYQMTATSATSGNTTSITLANGLIRSAADNDVITRVTAGAVSGAYALGYYKFITTSSGTYYPGQLVNFNTTLTVYTVIQVVGATILLDRPLEASLANADVIHGGPQGDFNFGFHRNALALVSRPLAPAKSGVGALSAIAAYNGLSMRATITYNGTKQGHLITLDALFGVKQLDQHLGVVLCT